MRIFQEITPFSTSKPLALSLGMFDGVHLGHLEIIEQLKTVASEKNLETAILTFWPHPRLVFNPSDDIKLLNTLHEKLELLEKSGIDNVIVKNFDEEFRNLTGEEFVQQVLVEKLRVKHLIIGHDHTFGKNKSGNFALLQRLGKELDFEVEQVEAVLHNNLNISSTKIRNCVTDGNVKAAAEKLGYHYSITGKVVEGKQIGRTIGYPTANLETDPLKILPKKGAYIVEVWLKEKFYKGMLSVGTNPTVNGEKLSVEVYILDFNEDIYGEEFTVRFRDFLHEEIKFENLEKLVERLDEDKKLTENFSF